MINVVSRKNVVKKKDSYSFKALFIHIPLILFCLFCLVPLLLVISISLSSDQAIVKEGYKLIPSKIDITAYKYLLKYPKDLLRAYSISIFTTVVGTSFSLLITTMLAYGISRKDYKYRRATSFYVFITMLFSGGIVPWYILITNVLKINNTLAVLIIPYLVVPFNVLLMKGFLQGIPDAILEAAKIDGAKEFKIFFKIIIPLSKPALATVGLFIMLMYWNDWWLSLMFIDNPNLVNIQYMLQRIMANIQFLLSPIAQQAGGNIDVAKIPNVSARMAMCILAAGPMLFVFPFFQKYFEKGLTIGSVKG